MLTTAQANHQQTKPMLSELLGGSWEKTEVTLEAKEGKSAVNLDWFVLQGASHVNHMASWNV